MNKISTFGDLTKFKYGTVQKRRKKVATVDGYNLCRTLLKIDQKLPNQPELSTAKCTSTTKGAISRKAKSWGPSNDV